MPNVKPLLREIFDAALRSADPAAAVERQVEMLRNRYGSGGYDRLLVAGFGKAAVPMALTLEKKLGDLITAGAVITTRGHGTHHGLRSIGVYEAGHPVPDEAGMRATEALLGLLAGADARTMVVLLVSGGGSALFVAPHRGITMAEKQETTGLLLRAGAEIRELNTVRKHLSRVKGGRLAELLHPATVVSLILSDVIGDRLDLIASGPTAPDPSTFGDALAVLEHYGLGMSVPAPVIAHLTRGARGLVPETPAAQAPCFRTVENLIIGSNRLALEGAKIRAARLGFAPEILSAEVAGEAREAGRKLAHAARNAARRKRDRPLCLISGGETTVTVTGNGKGGRNMEFALSFAREIEGVPGVTLLSAGTDGIDGPTDAAGALVDGTTVEKARSLGLDPEMYLQNNDSYHFFREVGGLFVTGPTGTNVMDIQITVVGQTA